MPSRLCAVIIAVGTALIGLMNPSAGAEELRLEYLALRGGFTGFVIGHYQPVTFNQADAALTARLPWHKEMTPAASICISSNLPIGLTQSDLRKGKRCEGLPPGGSSGHFLLHSCEVGGH